MTNIVPVLNMLDLPVSAGNADAVEEIRRLQRLIRTQQKRIGELQEAASEDRARLRRAENPDNWRAIWSGENETADQLTTPLVHGNYVELKGVGQFLLQFHPCCQNLRCECTQLNAHGHCACHANDE